MTPDSLDVQASEVHQNMVMRAYNFMFTEVAQVCGARWSESEKKRFRGLYNEAADNWPAYRQALEELKSIVEGRSKVDAMSRLREPRRDYINALEAFCEAFSSTLDNFFPLPENLH